MSKPEYKYPKGVPDTLVLFLNSLYSPNYFHLLFVLYFLYAHFILYALYTMVYICMNWYTLVYMGIHWYTLVHIGTHCLHW